MFADNRKRLFKMHINFPPLLPPCPQPISTAALELAEAHTQSSFYLVLVITTPASTHTHTLFLPCRLLFRVRQPGTAFEVILNM